METNPLRREEPAPANLAQLYRGELIRSDRWRTRLDTTTNWAVTTVAAIISFAFANSGSSHAILVVGVWLVIAYLFIEARRYRYYDLWIHRVRLLEGGFWVPALREEAADPDALKELAAELARPQLRISLLTALATRLRETYGPILLVILATWYVKIHAAAGPAPGVRQVLEQARLGWVPGAVVFGLMTALSAAFVMLYVLAWMMRAPVGELRPRPGLTSLRALARLTARPHRLRPPPAPGNQREPASPGSSAS